MTICLLLLPMLIHRYFCAVEKAYQASILNGPGTLFTF